MHMIGKRLANLYSVLALILTMSTEVHAQAMGFGGSPGSFISFNFPIMSPQFSRHVLQTAKGGKTAQPAPATSVELSVGDDPALSACAKEAFLADIHRGANNGLTGQIELSLQQRDVRSQFSEAVSPYGLSLDTLPDICAAYYAVMWMIANQAGLPTRPELQGLRRQLRGVFAEENAQLDAARRQLGVEEIMYKTVWLIHLRQEAQHLGNQKKRNSNSPTLPGKRSSASKTSICARCG